MSLLPRDGGVGGGDGVGWAGCTGEAGCTGGVVGCAGGVWVGGVGGVDGAGGAEEGSSVATAARPTHMKHAPPPSTSTPAMIAITMMRRFELLAGRGGGGWYG